jgi:hypothetical protein
MKTSKIIALLFVSLLLTSSCAIKKNVSPVNREIEAGATICIELNPDVLEQDILGVIKSGISRNGFKATVYKKIPDTCKYSMKYAAYQKWDFTTFLSYANIQLFDVDELIGSVEYGLPSGVFGSGGINPEKFSGTDEKISPLIDRLFVKLN